MKIFKIILLLIIKRSSDDIKELNIYKYKIESYVFFYQCWLDEKCSNNFPTINFGIWVRLKDIFKDEISTSAYCSVLTD